MILQYKDWIKLTRFAHNSLPEWPQKRRFDLWVLYSHNSIHLLLKQKFLAQLKAVTLFQIFGIDSEMQWEWSSFCNRPQSCSSFLLFLFFLFLVLLFLNQRLSACLPPLRRFPSSRSPKRPGGITDSLTHWLTVWQTDFNVKTRRAQTTS